MRLPVGLVLCVVRPEQSFATTVRVNVRPVRKVTELLQNVMDKATEEKVWRPSIRNSGHSNPNAKS